VGRVRLGISLDYFMTRLPARSETLEIRKTLEKISLSLQTAKKATKDFAAAPTVQNDPRLQEVSGALKKRIKKALKALEVTNDAWLEQIEQRE
jgi:hypothetical protein